MEHPMLDASCLPFYEWLDVPLWVFDAERMRAEWANPAALAYWQVGSLEAWRALDIADASADSHERLAIARQGHARGQIVRQAWTLRRGGRSLPCRLQSRGIRLADGRTALLVMAEPPADVAQLAKSEFLAHMGHELRTPMNGILGLIDLALRSDELSERPRRFISLAHQSARGLMVLLDALFDIAGLEAGRSVPVRVPFSLGDCVADALDTLSPAARAKGLRLGWHIDPALPGVLVGDGMRLRQVLIHLFSNALKFTPAGEVLLDLRACPDPAGLPGEIALQLSVRDTGIGMTAEQLGRVFEPFEQGDASPARRYGGAGLGLAIVARSVALLGGTLSVDSHLGAGTQVTIRLRMGLPLVAASWSSPLPALLAPRSA